jgi:argininosuccinate lyase
VHAELDLSVAGAGGSAGSRWPLDRERLAELLGAAGVVPHVKDAMWQVDPYLDLTGAVATQALHASMLGQDLEIACSHEFGQVRLAEGHSRASALMPQKRNPYALAVIRAFAGTAAGEHAGLLVVLHTGSARTDHFHVLNTVVPRLLDEAVSVARLAVAVVEGMSIDRAAMERPARDGFVTAADVADVMAQRGGLDYRAAHTVVGRAVRVLSESGRTADDLTPELLDGAISPDDLVHALDPVAAVASRRQTGSTRPGEVRRMADRMGREAEEARAWGAAAAKRAAAAAERLLARARALATAG